MQLLVQICQNDRNFYSYVEMPVRCRSSEEDFNVVVDASLLDVRAGASDDALLAAVFQTRDEDSGVDDETVSSALCVYRMSDVREQFTANIRRCFAGQQTYAGLQFGNRMCVSLVSTYCTLLIISGAFFLPGRIKPGCDEIARVDSTM